MRLEGGRGSGGQGQFLTRMLAPYPAIWDIATSLSFKKLFGIIASQRKEDHTMAEGRHILMAMFQGGGNIPQLLPIVTRLVTLGHRVRVLVGPGVRRSRLPVSESLWRSLHATGAQ